MHNDTDLDGVNVSQKDSYNCGPIACMIMWYFFIPHEVDLTVDVEEYQSKIILKLKKMLSDAKEAQQFSLCTQQTTASSE